MKKEKLFYESLEKKLQKRKLTLFCFRESFCCEPKTGHENILRVSLKQ